jgi:hypothetical protein
MIEITLRQQLVGRQQIDRLAEKVIFAPSRAFRPPARGGCSGPVLARSVEPLGRSENRALPAAFRRRGKRRGAPFGRCVADFHSPQ